MYSQEQLRTLLLEKSKNSVLFQKIVQNVLKTNESFINVNSQLITKLLQFVTFGLVFIAFILLVFVIPALIINYLHYSLDKLKLKLLNHALFYVVVIGIYYYIMSDYLLLTIILLFFTMGEVI